MWSLGGRIATSDLVLIVDDDYHFREALSDLIRDDGFDVVSADNGRHALDLLGAGLRPLAIFLDLMMPVMDGASFRAEQLKSPAIAAIPVAVLSASGTSRRQLPDAFGDVEVISKPMTGTEILAFLNRCRSARPASG